MSTLHIIDPNKPLQEQFEAIENSVMDEDFGSTKGDLIYKIALSHECQMRLWQWIDLLLIPVYRPLTRKETVLFCQWDAFLAHHLKWPEMLDLQ